MQEKLTIEVQKTQIQYFRPLSLQPDSSMFKTGSVGKCPVGPGYSTFEIGEANRARIEASTSTIQLPRVHAPLARAAA